MIIIRSRVSQLTKNDIDIGLVFMPTPRFDRFALPWRRKLEKFRHLSSAGFLVETSFLRINAYIYLHFFHYYYFIAEKVIQYT